MLLVNTEPSVVPENIPPSQTDVADADSNVSKEVNEPLDNGKLPVTEKVVASNIVEESSEQESVPSTEKTASSTQEDTPKKSFASIVSFIYIFLLIYLCSD